MMAVTMRSQKHDFDDHAVRTSDEKENPMAERKFKIGDIVQLKSGGPIMTVSGLTDNAAESSVVDTTWFAANEKECNGSFLEAILEAYSPDIL
jgi:uncharacterized protein YodC (DUF2158 family)